MIITTCDHIPGMRIVAVRGLVRGSSARARHIGHDLAALMRRLFGGEVLEYTRLLAQTREQSIDLLVREAELLGANGVVGVRLGTAEIAGAVAEVLCVGTAVLLESEPRISDLPAQSCR